jgi:Holliday junction resolvase RusA-like endonuclease
MLARMLVTFVVHGEPVPQPRPRVSTRGGFARAYVPAKHPVHAYRKQIALEAITAGLKPQSEPVEVIVEAVFARPKSHMTKKGVKATAPRLPRPDVDNIAKAVLDSLQDVMGDDTNVRRLTVEKTFGNQSQTTVSVKCENP